MNVQKLILEGIKEQLYCHNYLVIPGFGGFVLKSYPAKLSNSGTTLLPGGKSIGFNAQLKINDGVLALWLQEKIKCSAQEALEHLNDFGNYCQGVLKSRRRLNLAGLGFFYLDFENNTCFESENINFNPDSFGLAPVYLKELETRPAENRQPASFINRTADTAKGETAPEVKKARHLKVWLVPLVSIMVVVVFSAFLILGSKKQNQFTASIFGNSPAPTFSPLQYPPLELKPLELNNTETYVADANGIAGITLSENKTISVRVFEIQGSVAKTTAKSWIQNAPAGHSEIVLGCFSIKSNAERMVSKLRSKNVEAYIAGVMHKGMSVVCYSQYPDKKTAASTLDEIRSVFPNAWIREAK